jgi:hypothetical protein
MTALAAQDHACACLLVMSNFRWNRPAPPLQSQFMVLLFIKLATVRVGHPVEVHPVPLSILCNGEITVKIWFWLLLSLLMLMVGCASSYHAGMTSASHEEISDYWSRVLYHQTAAESERR